MSSNWGKNLKLSIFGESHGTGIGVVLDGLPAGCRVNLEELCAFMARRAPGRGGFSTTRKETDLPEILSGIMDHTTTGTPIAAVIRNENTRSNDYVATRFTPRPGHADYTGHIRYQGHEDYRGGGHFSGRLTAPLVFAGGICKQLLFAQGITIGAHLLQVHREKDRAFDPMQISQDELISLGSKPFPTLEDQPAAAMIHMIEQARKEGDSVGGIIECAAIGLPAGIGSPMFDGVENIVSSLIFGIPAVRGIEFGSGFDCVNLFGSQHNDAYGMQGEKIITKTNHHGGVLGGITSGMPLLFKVAMKPTPSIAKEQQTVDLLKQEDTTIQVKGRHDACLAVRAVACVEAVAAIAITELLLENGGQRWI